MSTLYFLCYFPLNWFFLASLREFCVNGSRSRQTVSVYEFGAGLEGFNVVRCRVNVMTMRMRRPEIFFQEFAQSEEREILLMWTPSDDLDLI